MTDLKLREDVTAELVQHIGGDASIIAAARVSTVGTESVDALTEDPAGAAGLINFLIKNRHGSPFEHASMTFLVEAPIFVFREFHRHRVGWSYNEESGRYKQLEPVFYAPSTERPLVQVGKAGAYEFVEGNGYQHALVHNSIFEVALKAYARYELMLEEGIAKEVARTVLPVGTFSSMYATCNPRSLMHFLSLRTKTDNSTFKSYPQREIELVAEQMEQAFAALFPLTYTAWDKHGRVAP